MGHFATRAEMDRPEETGSALTDDGKRTLERLRKGLESTDDELLALVARRARQVRAIWAWKRHLGVPLFDADREDELTSRWTEKACRMGLDPEAVTLLVSELLAVTAPVSRTGIPAHCPPNRQPDGIESTASDAMPALHTADR